MLSQPDRLEWAPKIFSGIDYDRRDQKMTDRKTAEFD